MNVYKIKLKFVEERVSLVIANTIEDAIALAKRMLLCDWEQDIDPKDVQVLGACFANPMKSRDLLYSFNIPIAGNQSFDGEKTLPDIIDFITKNRPEFFKVRAAYCYQEKDPTISFAIYYEGKVDEAAHRAIEKCVNRGVDPYGH